MTAVWEEMCETHPELSESFPIERREAFRKPKGNIVFLYNRPISHHYLEAVEKLVQTELKRRAEAKAHSTFPRKGSEAEKREWVEGKLHALPDKVARNVRHRALAAEKKDPLMGYFTRLIPAHMPRDHAGPRTSSSGASSSQSHHGSMDLQHHPLRVAVARRERQLLKRALRRETGHSDTIPKARYLRDTLPAPKLAEPEHEAPPPPPDVPKFVFNGQDPDTLTKMLTAYNTLLKGGPLSAILGTVVDTEAGDRRSKVLHQVRAIAAHLTPNSVYLLPWKGWDPEIRCDTLTFVLVPPPRRSNFKEMALEGVTDPILERAYKGPS